ncbi:MAG: 30S ribosomal protein S20 [Myxococcota bacterium]
MANHKDAAKRATQSLKRRTRNRAYRTRMRNSIADLRTKISAGAEAGEVDGSLRSAISTIQRLVTKGVIHRNQAARRVARLTSAVATARTPAAEAPPPKAKAKAKAKPKSKSAKKK